MTDGLATTGLIASAADTALSFFALLTLVGLMVSTLWWPRPVLRAACALMLGGLLFVFVRPGAGVGAGLLVALLGAAAAVWMPSRVHRRVCFMVQALVLLVYVTTMLMYMAPGNPFRSEKAANEQVEAALREKYGVPEHAPAFFWVYMKRLVAEGSLGPSIKNQGRTVAELLLPAFPVSLALGMTALVIAAALGLWLGVRSGLKPNSLTDQGSMALAMIGISLPSFVIGTLLVTVFALQLGWLPVAGWGGYRHLLLPAITLALPYAAYIARLARGGTIEVMQQDFIRTARAKGLSERAVVLKHALKGAILPVVSFLGPAAAGIFTGSFVVENLFGIPGMGQWFVKSAINRDYSVVLGAALIYCALLTVFNLLVDMAYAWLDPRIREDL
jgi:oligopeptide transport system permease protein